MAKAKKLTGAAITALSALRKSIDELGVPVLASNLIPAKAKVVTTAQWRICAYEMGISNSKADRAKQVAFQRASELLIDEGLVGTDNGLHWEAEQVNVAG